ncbi:MULTISPECIES: (Fe-S)-binding protein [unclassified Candidatus Frackibacter]|uniref:(Fe-S)-binding protein n=1 Tax=unclassified Candidatus Frackibacter TaxID=2648818 RepID=UPI00079483CB|nr:MULTISPECIES: (Fe-S)-binding protein [unclassified Candidatus Frackibacter]KXS43520.1 MAG: glycolate oxidase iron-sulfur subunit [Candidatus Frackibacter sp. T328-2]SDC15296.1 glycolate oxidase iron-sulfur subunit [Candidatus Frackibacter sp. WG11]SEM46420.1 glycolate oxidase iron-sulfur subunit [Candidatus Frackibacter sp. WG12]SFL48381.1 glycolate oxidase iron-sulfur subunit [Candidatus Frackibacter sp. WG13]
MSKILKEVEEEVAKCMKCGLCRAVCPIFSELDNEATVARGKVNLIENVNSGELGLTDKYEKLMELCLMCKACVANCPCGVEVDKIVLKAREELAQDKGLSMIKKGIFSVLQNKFVFPLGMKLGSIFQGLAFSKNDGPQPGNNPRVSVGLDRRRVIPDLAEKTFKEEFPEVVKVDNPKARVAYYTGCTVNYIYPEFGESVVNVLVENGIEVVIPQGQQCCGTPVRIYGDTKTAKKLAQTNVEEFAKHNDVDAIITSCSSCGLALKEEFEEVLGTSPELKEFSDKVYDIAEYLVDVIDFDREGLGAVRRKVTYHDPCHLVRGMGVSEQPREILEAIPGVYFEEMDRPDRCCGSAGSFNLKYYDLSMDINKHKIEDIKQTGADTLATGCGACKMHISDGLNQAGMDQEIVHTVQLLDEAYQKRKVNREKKSKRAG